MARTQLPEGITIQQVEKSGEFEGKALKRYHVIKDGAVIGRVEQEPVSFEQRSPGNQYVNRRWKSVRWLYGGKSEMLKYRDWQETRVGAIGALLRHLSAP